jgi:hypothetical protein
MARYGIGRGTREGHGVLSGTTLAVVPSGVTIDARGITETSQVSYPVAYSAKTRTIVQGKADYSTANAGAVAGNSIVLTVTPGLTTVEYFWPYIYSVGTKGGAPAASSSLAVWAPLSSGSGVTIYTYNAAGAPATCECGVTVAWLAVGT